MKKKVAIYVRVSTKDQSVEMQLNDLERYSNERGFYVYKIYRDDGISGTRESRPALDELMNDARKKRYNTVLVWDFSRFARSSRHLITALEEFKNLNIDFVSYRENIDTSSPIGQAVFVIISAMAELEKNLIRERVKGGLRKARANGKRLGRPKRDVNTDKILEFRRQNKSIRQIARELNLTNNLVFRTLQKVQ